MDPVRVNYAIALAEHDQNEAALRDVIDALDAEQRDRLGRALDRMIVSTKVGTASNLTANLAAFGWNQASLALTRQFLDRRDEGME